MPNTTDYIIVGWDRCRTCHSQHPKGEEGPGGRGTCKECGWYSHVEILRADISDKLTQGIRNIVLPVDDYVALATTQNSRCSDHSVLDMLRRPGITIDWDRA